jgi:hypothetical protein
MLVNVSGEEFDGFLESNEYAGGLVLGDYRLHFPQGRGAEEVSDRKISLWAKPANDDFSFYVYASYSVKYPSP